MSKSSTKHESIKAYIAAQEPASVRTILKKIYATIKAAAPKQAEESISYGLPTFKLHNRPLIYFGAASKHIGIYATPDGHAAFKKELSKYKQGKGSVQLPLDQPIPYALIKKMVQYNARHLNAKYTSKQQ